MVIQDKANQVAALVYKDKAAQLDPVTIALIIQLIIAIVNMIKKWKNPTSAIDTVNNPGILARVALKTYLGVKLFRNPDAAAIKDAIYTVGQRTTLAELTAAYAEV